MAAGWSTATHFANPQAIGTDTTTSAGVTLTSGASNVKGVWAQIIASTAFDITHLLVCWSYFNGAAGGGNGLGAAIDIAVAPAGSETSGILIQNLIVPILGLYAEHYVLPVGQIPAGSRIAARFASSFASDTTCVSMVGFDSGWTSASNCGIWDTYGWSGSGAVQGFAVDCGAVLNTKGAYTELSASTTADLIGFFITWDPQNRNTAVGSYMDMLFDFSLGAAGSEVVILPNVMISRNGASWGLGFGPTVTSFLPIPIAAGSRLSCRSQAYNVTAVDRIMGVSVYGLRA